MSAVDDWLGASATAPATASAPVDPVDAWLGAGSPAPAAVAVPAHVATPVARPAATSDNLAADLAAGGAAPGTLGDLGDIASAAAHGVGSMFSNAANFAERNVARGANLVPGVQGSAVGNWLTDTANRDTAAQAAADQQFERTATPGQQVVAVVAPMALPLGGVMRAGNAVRAGVGALPGMGGALGRMLAAGAGNATNGAIMATGAPIDPMQSTGLQDFKHVGVGAGLGALLPAGAAIATRTASGVQNALQPVLSPRSYVGNGLAGAVGNQAADVASSIRNAPTYVDGSTPTLAQVAGTPTLVATEKAARTGIPGFAQSLAEREAQNNQARWDALTGVAQTPATLEAALRARNAAVEPIYDQARAGMYEVAPELESLMERPAMQQALARGVAIAQNEGNRGIIPGTEAAAAQYTNVPTGGVGFNGAPLFQQLMTRAATPGAPPQISGDVLHYMKLGLDDLEASAQENTRLGPTERAAIGQARRDYLNWLDEVSPSYRQARETYASLSPAINSMQAGQSIVNNVGGLGRSLNTSGAPLISAPTYANQLGLALRNQEFGIEPAAQQTLENIGHDLQRSTISNSMRAPGSDTAYNLAANGWLANQLYGPNFGGMGSAAKSAAALGATLAGHPMVGLGILGGANRVGQMVGNRLNQQLADLLLNPSGLLPYLDGRAQAATLVPNQSISSLIGDDAYPRALGAGLRFFFQPSAGQPNGDGR